MTYLLADVGGTNTRLALSDAGGLRAHSVRRYNNEEFASFDDLLAGYLAQMQAGEIAASCAGMAGPVADGRGRLTNRDWWLSEAALATICDAPKALLFNDLTALGYAVTQIGPDGVAPVSGLTGIANGQKLVIGIGTGFNVCPVRVTPFGPVCLEAEAGHVELPLAVCNGLAGLGLDPAQFPSVEELFSGRGLARFHLLHSKENASGAEIADAFARGQGAAQKTFAAYAGLIGALCQALILQYMPRDGIYFAGSVARGVLITQMHGRFAEAMQSAALFDPELAGLPVFTVTDDAAALTGCHVAVQAL